MKIIFVKTKGFNTMKTHYELVYKTYSFQFMRDKLTKRNVCLCSSQKLQYTFNFYDGGFLVRGVFRGALGEKTFERHKIQERIFKNN